MAIMDKGIRVTVPTSSYVSGESQHRVTAGFTITAEYTNFTDMPVYIKTQTNMPYALEPNTTSVCMDEPRPNIEIKLTYKLSSNAGITGTLDMLTAMVANDCMLSDDAVKLYEKITALFRQDSGRANKMNFCFTVFRRIMEDDLIKTRQIYLRECDVIMSRDREVMSSPHPNSSTGMQQSEIANTKLYSGQAGVFLKVVDNDCIAPVRYYYAGKQLIAVPSVIDPACESGVYYTISTQSSDGGLTPRTATMSFGDAETKLGLYRFKEDALSHGNPEIFLKSEEARHRAEERQATLALQRGKSENDQRNLEAEAEIIELKRLLEKQKVETATAKDNSDLFKAVREDKADSNKKNREHKKAKAEAKAQRRQLAIDAEQRILDAERKARDDYYDRKEKERKDHFEDRSYVRKDTSEMIKYVPALILGIAGTFAFMKARQNS